MKEFVDRIGNVLEVGDHVLIRVPDSDSTYRQGIIRAIKEDPYFGLHNYQVEYVNDRLYCNMPWYNIRPGCDIKFTNKTIKVWCDRDRLVKFDPKYIE